MIYIHGMDAAELKHLQLTDMAGRLVLEASRTTALNLSAFDNGMYYLSVETAHGDLLKRKILLTR
jgi:hypothetical protein